MRFVFVNKNNFGRFNKFIVHNEKFFNPKLRTPKLEYEKVISDVSQVSILLFNNNFVGHIIGYASDDVCFYVFSLLVVPKFRGKGYSKLLFSKLCKVLKSKGYKFVEGHFNNVSIKLLSNRKIVKQNRVYKGYKYVRVKL